MDGEDIAKEVMRLFGELITGPPLGLDRSYIFFISISHTKIHCMITFHVSTP